MCAKLRKKTPLTPSSSNYQSDMLILLDYIIPFIVDISTNSQELVGHSKFAFFFIRKFVQNGFTFNYLCLHYCLLACRIRDTGLLHGQVQNGNAVLKSFAIQVAKRVFFETEPNFRVLQQHAKIVFSL